MDWKSVVKTWKTCEIKQISFTKFFKNGPFQEKNDLFDSVDNRVVGSYCTSKLFQEMFHGRKTNLFKKSPRLFGFQRSQIESQLNGADGWELRTQWNILSKYQEIITKYPTVFSTLSRQHHSAVTQFGFFGQGNISPI